MPIPVCNPGARVNTPGKDLLAGDESTGMTEKRFKAVTLPLVSCQG
jgi:fructose-bisphosphate aldolase class 1